MINNDVFERTEADSSGELISPGLYNLTIGMTLLWGFGVNWAMVKYVDPVAVLRFGPWPFLLGYFASCMAGITLFRKSDKPHVSFLGYNLVVVPFGFVVNLVVAQYDPDLVLDAMMVTGGVTLVMMCLGSLFPAFFKKIAGALTVALLAVICVELLSIFWLDLDQNVIDWVVVVIFCGYIGYDWGRANAIPKTLDNAVDSAAAIYMDIINLFLRLLRIMGRRRR